MRRTVSISLVLLALVSRTAVGAVLWKCTDNSGTVIYTNQGAENIRVLECKSVTIKNADSGSLEKKFSCNVEFTGQSYLKKEAQIKDTDMTGVSSRCTVLSETGSPKEQSEASRAKNESLSRQSPRESIGWLAIASNEKTTLYVDPATIRRVGTMAKIWSVLDLRTPPVDSPIGKPYLSIRMQTQCDCTEEQARNLFTSYHAGNMVGGETIITSSDPTNWSPIPPASGGKAICEAACSKR